jgi:hypothetical protein
MSIYCRVDVYILQGRCLYTAGSMSIYCRVDVYILQGLCLYTAGSMSIYCTQNRTDISTVQGRCLYTSHRTELTFRPCRVDVDILLTEQIWLWSTFRPCRVDVYILRTEQIWLWSTYICIYLYQAGAELAFTYSSSTEQKFQTLFLFASSNVYSFLLLLNMNGQVGRFI